MGIIIGIFFLVVAFFVGLAGIVIPFAMKKRFMFVGITSFCIFLGVVNILFTIRDVMLLIIHSS